ncbi:MAG: c-type cytochrome biogenesis protein CcsB [Nitrospirae bacterium]|nr:c-type cytochrome biogenesis protein CcsB [Nitrospirota bacterium]
MTFELALTAYFIATILAILELIVASKATSKGMTIFICAGFIFHTLNIFMRLFISGHMPTASLHEAASFFTWSIVLVFFIIEHRYKVGLLGSFVLPGVLVLMLSSSVLPRQIQPLSPLLKNSWLWLHTILAFVGEAALAVACGVGVMYLIQQRNVKSKKLDGLFQRLPSLSVLDEVNYRLITIGFPLLTLAIITGALWSQAVWGTYFRWDPKLVWSLITWLFYAAVLHARMTAGWQGRKTAILSAAGFIAILFTFFGVNLLMKTFHGFE